MTAQPKAQRRLLAVDRVRKGDYQQEVADFLVDAPSAVSRWMKVVRYGPKGWPANYER